MRPARTYPDQRDDVRLLVIDPAAPEGAGLRETRTPARPELLAPGDLLVVNDAATLPASLHGTDDNGRQIEVRLIAARGSWREDAGASSSIRSTAVRFAAVLFGAGDWHTRTEDRPPPPELAEGARLRFGALRATVGRQATLSPRLVELRFEGDSDALWASLYKEGRPVQYAHLAHDLPLWAVQTVYATRPWAFEMPSAGRPLSWEILLALRRRGVRWASLTHAAGLSATGDPAIDAALPLPEAFEIPAATARAVAETHARGGRIVAVGTTVVRALEGAAQQHDGIVRAVRGETDLRITPAFRPRVVDGILSGAHGAHESHFQLLAAFAGADLLAAAAAQAERAGFLTHELGDSMLVLPGSLAEASRKATSAP
jgi:S-adenosylmethionine:tRNA ribosyltransferase-isomerase